MLPVRVFFEKKDMARYISHLDLQRAVRRAVERSGLTVRQTEGFNPHPKMVFSMPLSMYQESLCEFVDMEMDGAGYDEIAARLAAAFPPGLRVTAAAAPVFPVKRIKYAVYRIGIVTSLAAAEAERALAGPMPVEKRGKSGVRTLDIRPLIRDCAVAQTEDGLARAATGAAAGELSQPVVHRRVPRSGGGGRPRAAQEIPAGRRRRVLLIEKTCAKRRTVL